MGAGGASFNRRSVVGLASERFGSIDIGRDYTPFFHAQVATDATYYGGYGNLLGIMGATMTSEQFLRASNAVFYTAPKLGGLTLRAMHSAGTERFASDILGPRGQGRMAGVGGEFCHGPFLVTAAYQTVDMDNGAGGIDRRHDSVLGARYDAGRYSVNGGWARVENPGADNDAR